MNRRLVRLDAARQLESESTRNDRTMSSKIDTIKEFKEILGVFAETAALRKIRSLAREMGMVGAVRQLDDIEIYDLPDSWDTTDISRGDLRNADAILETEDRTGQTCYVAVEISYTVNGTDTRRALRNAQFLTRYTGKPAHAAVMGVRTDERIRDLIASGEVHWETTGSAN